MHAICAAAGCQLPPISADTARPCVPERHLGAMPSVEMSAHSGTASAWFTSAIAVDWWSAPGSLALSVGVLCHVFADLGRWVARL